MPTTVLLNIYVLSAPQGRLGGDLVGSLGPPPRRFLPAAAAALRHVAAAARGGQKRHLPQPPLLPCPSLLPLHHHALPLPSSASRIHAFVGRICLPRYRICVLGVRSWPGSGHQVAGSVGGGALGSAVGGGGAPLLLAGGLCLRSVRLPFAGSGRGQALASGPVLHLARDGLRPPVAVASFPLPMTVLSSSLPGSLPWPCCGWLPHPLAAGWLLGTSLPPWLGCAPTLGVDSVLGLSPCPASC